jgi:AraC-like DNA-binding protein
MPSGALKANVSSIRLRADSLTNLPGLTAGGAILTGDRFQPLGSAVLVVDCPTCHHRRLHVPRSEAAMGALAARSASSSEAQPIVLASAATGVAPFIERMGGDVDRIFGNSGISPEMAGSPTLKLKLSDYCTLFEQAADRTRHDNFGLWFGQQFRPRDLGLWGYAVVSSPTLGSAIENLVGLFHYHQESSVMQLGKTELGLMRLSYQITAAQIVERRQDAELSLGMFLNVIREACGEAWSPEEVYFEHPRPEAWKEHEEAFGAPCYFSQKTNALVFRPEVLARPMPGRDLKLFTMMRTCLESLGSHRDVGDSIYDRVRTAIRVNLPSGAPSAEIVAAELHLSLCAIHRELAARNVTFKDTLESVRQDLALMYLRQRQMPLTEIALLLGYSELSAFTRAFTRWAGKSPSAFRRGH